MSEPKGKLIFLSLATPSHNERVGVVTLLHPDKRTTRGGFKSWEHAQEMAKKLDYTIETVTEPEQVRTMIREWLT